MEIREASPERLEERTSYPPSQHKSVVKDDVAPEGAFDALPPQDKGYAWWFLLGGALMEVLVWGMPYSLGVLHSYWTTTLFPPGTPGTDMLAVAVAMQNGLLYCSAVVFHPILARYPYHRVKLQLGALGISVLGLVTSAFATKPWHLVVTLGILYPFSCMYYLPAATFLYEWFAAKRGLATGMLYAGSGIGGTIYPIVIHQLLVRFRYKTAMISLGIGYAIVGILANTLIKPRLPIAPSESHQRPKLDMSFLRRSPAYAFCSCILLCSLGNFLPSVWIPSFALDIGLSEGQSTMLVSLMNGSSAFGYLFVGWLSDRYPLHFCITLTCLGSSLACFFLWGFAKNIGVLCVFVMLFGSLGIGFSAMWLKLIAIIARDDPALPGHLFSVFSFIRGIGNISSGPVSNALLASSVLVGAPGGYGVKNYGSLILYAGCTTAAGSVAGVLWRDRKSSVNRVQA